MEVSRSTDLLGKFAERYPGLLLRLGRWETGWVEDDLAEQRIDRPIYVTGLARSGTTISLELLAAHSDVATHQYRDFPLVPIPIWWNWFIDRASSGPSEAVERAHKDGIDVTPDSPEAMEEVLWMAFFAHCHDPAVSNVLGKDATAPAFEAFYRNHIRKLLLVRGGKRYLAKGNYNISRLGYLQKLFADARFVIPVRDPAGHIASLMKQQELFCTEETRDPRVLDHMRRTGHFEFGLDRRPINFGEKDLVDRIQEQWTSGQEVEGWALYWNAVYGHVADLLEAEPAIAAKSMLVHYDDLCGEPNVTLKRLYAHCELEVDKATRQAQAARIAAPTYYKSGFDEQQTELIRSATEATHDRIRELSRAAASG
ncbi:MAG: sulfotransferase [Pseudomonadota bacterium]